MGFLQIDVLGLGPTSISSTGTGEQAFEACNISPNELLSNLSETRISFEFWVDNSHSCIRHLSTHLVSVHCRSAKPRGTDLLLWCLSRVVPDRGVLRLCLYYRQRCCMETSEEALYKLNWIASSEGMSNQTRRLSI